MDTFNAPGIYLEPLQPLRISGDLLRSDIAAFIGYARQGPVGLPVRVESWRQFGAIFGQPLNGGHLALAVKAFFENGGATCYIHRLTDGTQAAAQVRIEDGEDLASANAWRCYAAFRLSDIAPVESPDNTLADDALIHRLGPGDTRQPLRNPGTWGNVLTISVLPSSRLSTAINGSFDEGYSTWVDSLVGLEPTSIVKLSQEQIDGSLLQKTIAIAAIDRFAQTITWHQPVFGPGAFTAAKPVRIDTMEFDVKVYFEGRQVEHFEWLSPHPDHSRSLHKVIAGQSRYVSLEFLGDLHQDWLNAELWPRTVERLPLNGGRDGLATVAAEHYLEALAVIRKVDDIAMVAAPDLTLRMVEANQPVTENTPVPIPCRALQPPHKGVISGRVSDGIQPLAGVFVTDAGTGQQVISKHNGTFLLEQLELSLHTLRLEKPGFAKAERQIFAAGTPPAVPEEFSLVPLALPRTLTELEVVTVQQALLNPAIIGPFRIALLDPPMAIMRVDEIRSWRSKIGDSAFGALFYPWLEAPSAALNDPQLYPVPPCGHVAGLLARMDIERGPHRAPANIKLRFAKRALTAANSIEHGLINAEGINLIRSQPGQGIRILGARTLSSAPEWRYINVRRLVLAMEKTLERALQWAVYESNSPVLRQAVVQSIGTLLNALWRRGALAGKTAAAAYLVKCDSDNNPASQRDQGRLLAEVQIAPSVPFEFIRIRFGKTLDAIEVTE